jgi:nucleoside-diphosphate-sugar epimerase
VGATAFVTGGTGLVGRALVALLRQEGWRVEALARTPAAAEALRAAGAEPVGGELPGPGAWEERAAAADAAFHLAAPRIRPPVRVRRIRAACGPAAEMAGAVARARAGRPLVLASSAHAAADGAPLPVALAARAAEAAAAGPGLAVVRLPFVYGPGGLLGDVAIGLDRRRFRIVGPGDNRWALVSDTDAARALLAAHVAPGTWWAEEPDHPTEAEVVHVICAGRGARRPDHLPPRMAAAVLGGALAGALAADATPAGPAPPGWSPELAWREDLVERLSRARPREG